MTRDVLRRLVLLAAATGYVLVLCLTAVYVAWWVGVAAATAGPLLAVLLTVEPAPPSAKKPEPAYPDGTLVERNGRMEPLRRGRMPAETEGDA